jgi:hypothetical protein
MASNQRPMLVVSGQLSPVSSWRSSMGRPGRSLQVLRQGSSGQPVPQAHGHAPWLARGLVATGQRQGGDVAHALATGPFQHHQFAAPGTAVLAQAIAVQRQPQQGLAGPVRP